MPAGLQSHHHISPPQTALAGSPSRKMENARLASCPHNCSCIPQSWSGGGVATEPAGQQGQGTEGLGRAGQATWEKPKTDPSIAEEPVTELHRATRMPRWTHSCGRTCLGEVTGQQPLGHTDLSVTTIKPCLKASHHPTPRQTIHQASSVSTQFFILNLMSEKYFGSK